ncbi:type I restriction endonuclease subunit R [Kribbella sp. NPDC051936]|uniref:type I restriction endonuclease subunit R n=1 Tax=Kribbella sp. NPDC051936 TaxID=3154946 RepID=UPI00343F6D1C
MSEAAVEQAALGWFESAGFSTFRGPEISPGGDDPLRGSYEQTVLETRLEAALVAINSHLPDEAIHDAMRVVTRPPEPTLIRNNRWFHRLLADGVDVEYRTPNGDVRGDKAWLVDFDEPARNDFVTVQQFTVKAGNQSRRVDLVAFLNGLPIACVELKDPTDERADLWTAFAQLEDYKATIPQLFLYNELMVISDGLLTRLGSVTSGRDRYAPWRSLLEANTESGSALEVLITELFDPPALLDYLRHCVVFEEDQQSGSITKKVAGYHQFRAVRKARRSVTEALRPAGDGRGGVVWHTQGSGKSLTMLMLAGTLVTDPALENPTIVVVTDRNDLDDQLFGTFASGRALLRQTPEQAIDRDDLAAKLNRASGGVVFTTIQKFESRPTPASERTNIVVLADEAHRSQYGFLQGGARWMREALPNATYVGFTGTPLERDDRSTRAVFGSDVDVYDIRRAVDDHATVPIYYEMRLIRLAPNEAGMAAADRQLTAIAEANREGKSPPADVTVPLELLVGSQMRLKTVAAEIVEHFEERRTAIEGKALAVTMSRQIAMDLYDELVELRPDWHSDEDSEGFVKVVMTGSSSEGERVAAHARTKARRERLASRFKDPEDDLRLVLVCDMWLTGFDCPPLHTMYLDKPLAGHNLMQAIARVNRVFGDKPGGVVVDFLGVADELRDAVQTYTQAGGQGTPVARIQEDAVPLMLRDFESLRDFFDGVDHADFVSATSEEQLTAVASGADHVFAQPEGQRRFLKLVASLSKAFALCVPHPEAEAIRDDLVYFQSVRAAIRKRLSDTVDRGVPDARAAVRQVISDAIAAEGVIDLFEAAGLDAQNVAVLSEDFLHQLAMMPQRNLALETLRKLLNDQIRIRERVNLVQAKGFRESLESVLTQYTNRAISTAQIIEELIALARFVRETIESGKESGLNEEELAFYDALADNESARQVIEDDTLRLIARELTERIRAKSSLDWTERETVRADMRRTVRRLLAKHGYPPDAQESATRLVISQAELVARHLAM